MNETFYGHTLKINGLLKLGHSDTHIHNIDAKRYKVDNDSATYLWHCRLGHIGVKRMKKLHADGLLESLDYESFDTYEPCLMGKMTKTLFSETMEWANDLLEIIHTDVCGPMSVDARSGYNYFLTFTDELSRYGYIYLMKHTSETFEKFKQFQSEVENHHNKKIKFLRSDQGKSIWVVSLAITKDKVESFHSWRHLEHHSVMVCPSVVVAPYWLWCDLWYLLPIYHNGFWVMH